ncbi:exodeoxyribonuclease VII large subunit [Desulfatirhabdium butyrativorans]|uniref:exodeoxyribonuclease VII large subunit n=1 Tax=Desulfatirhabdium butyrativorans TaxID=340467 RepID=UPI0004034FF8|nr:exodeoxyribonuclease VII large subunit [Desulfatirhabdium butyrativorans]
MQSHIYTVSELTQNIKNLLEETYPILWISGEISNLSIPSSGHFYFTLKDDKAQIRAVLFKGQARNLSFRLENGLSIVGMGRISVYPPQGQYQFILETVEPKGRGALQLAFEQLKARLHQEGLFDASLKKPLPFLPKRICVITSPSGAVIHDMIQIMGRRFPSIPIQVIPVRVQGQGAENEIVAALDLANTLQQADVLVIARGGGSLEDLQPFNTEILARAIHASRIPVVSAIGHETDYTIADFVADLRAPTPSAAAELVVPEREALKASLSELNLRVRAGLERSLRQLRESLVGIQSRLVRPKRFLADRILAIDDLQNRAIGSIQRRIHVARERYLHFKSMIFAYHPGRWIDKHQAILDRIHKEMMTHLSNRIAQKRHRARELVASLQALSPLAILKRGYSITQTLPGQQVVTTAETAPETSLVSIRLYRGSLICRVERSLHGEDDI